MNALYVQIYTYDIYVYIDCAYAAICCTVINVYCYNFGSLRKSKLHLAFFKTETRKIGKHKKMFHRIVTINVFYFPIGLQFYWNFPH